MHILTLSTSCSLGNQKVIQQEHWGWKADKEIIKKIDLNGKFSFKALPDVPSTTTKLFALIVCEFSCHQSMSSLNIICWPSAQRLQRAAGSHAFTVMKTEVNVLVCCCLLGLSAILSMQSKHENILDFNCDSFGLLR